MSRTPRAASRRWKRALLYLTIFWVTLTYFFHSYLLYSWADPNSEEDTRLLLLHKRLAVDKVKKEVHTRDHLLGDRLQKPSVVTAEEVVLVVDVHSPVLSKKLNGTGVTGKREGEFHERRAVADTVVDEKDRKEKVNDKQKETLRKILNPNKQDGRRVGAINSNFDEDDDLDNDKISKKKKIMKQMKKKKTKKKKKNNKMMMKIKAVGNWRIKRKSKSMLGRVVDIALEPLEETRVEKSRLPRAKKDLVQIQRAHNESVVYPRFVDNGPPDGPGEGGKAVLWEKEDLTKDEQREWNRGFETHRFNQYISDRVSVRRAIRDPRPRECRDVKYQTSSLPVCDVIIVFHNEAWSALLRSVYSVLTRTPPTLLHSVILVDDKSTLEHLGKPLEQYFSSFAKVRIVRSPKRGGLTRARLLGFAKAVSDVVVFLDSHIECSIGWYEPLVQPIMKDARAVTFPSIDTIDSSTLEVVFRRSIYKGSVDLASLLFTWVPAETISDLTQPVPSATMPGGLFAISRQWFHELGTYDPGLLFWGGENLELSFKTWMCNGSLFTIPCSHVGHIFRETNPVTWSIGENPLIRNSLRVAAVWMDRVGLYYMDNFRNKQFGDISSRKALREKLHCKDFGWYVNNVLPELKSQIDNTSPYAGEIRSQAEAVCVDSGGSDQDGPFVFPCHGMGMSQVWMLTATGELKQNRKYISYRDEALVLVARTSGGEWKYQSDGSLLHVPTDRCLQAGTDSRTLSLVPCQPSPWQRWNLRQRDPRLLQPLSVVLDRNRRQRPKDTD